MSSLATPMCRQRPGLQAYQGIKRNLAAYERTLGDIVLPILGTERLDYRNPTNHPAFWIKIDDYLRSTVCPNYGFREFCLWRETFNQRHPQEAIK